MTLIATLKLNGLPILIGDMITSRIGLSQVHRAIPTIPHELVTKVLPEEWLRSIVGVRRKVCRISDYLALGWTGDVVAAKPVLKALKRCIGPDRISIEQLGKFFGDFESLTGRCVIAGWLIDQNSPISFRWDSQSRSWLTGNEPYVEGSGKEALLRRMAEKAALSEYSAGINTDLGKAIHYALALVGNFIGREVLLGDNIQQLFGGGFEILYFDGKRFCQLDDITFLFWFFDVENSFLHRLPVFLKPQYIEDTLLIHAVRLEETENVVHRTEREIHSVIPLFLDKVDFDLRSIKFRGLQSSYYCNFLFSRASGSEVNLAITVEAGENELVRFRAVEPAKQILEVSDNFVELIRHCFANWLNQIAFRLKKKAEITSMGNPEPLYAEACKNYAAAVRLKPDLYEAIGDWAVALFHWAKLERGEKAKQLFDEARSKLLELTEATPIDAYYNLACLSSLEGDEPECRTWLEKCMSRDSQRSRDEMSTDPDFENMKDKEWFTAMLDRSETS